MKKYFLILLTLLSFYGYGQTNETNSLKKILIGKWKDELSTFTLSENGSYVIVYNSGLEQKGTWKEKDFVLIFKPGNSSDIIQYRIIDYSSGDFGYSILKKGKISTQSYHAIKVNE